MHKLDELHGLLNYNKHNPSSRQGHGDKLTLIMGDFNQLPIKLNNYYQIVKTPIRNKRTLYKCFVRVKNGYSQCRQLGNLGKSDHHVMHLIPT